MLVNDMRSFNIMSSTDIRFAMMLLIQFKCLLQWVIFLEDKESLFHSVRAACAAGINSLFMEVHDNPEKALSDANTV